MYTLVTLHMDGSGPVGVQSLPLGDVFSVSDVLFAGAKGEIFFLIQSG